MNPYMRWTDGGKTFVCNFCGHSNPCPDVYFNYLGPDGRCVAGSCLCCALAAYFALLAALIILQALASALTLRSW
jgi:hypothetical protein